MTHHTQSSHVHNQPVLDVKRKGAISTELQGSIHGNATGM